MTMSAMPSMGDFVIWGLVATIAMTTILEGAGGLGFTRLSLPFLAGSFFTAERRWAVLIGFAFYIVGGWIFAAFYYWLFASVHFSTWWFGALLGVLHGLFLLVVILPLLPYFHPRMASEYAGPSSQSVLEPPGFMGLNYGPQTPLTTLLAQAVYGLVLGGLPQIFGL